MIGMFLCSVPQSCRKSIKDDGVPPSLPIYSSGKFKGQVKGKKLTVLRAQNRALAAQGLHLVTGVETEWHLLHPTQAPPQPTPFHSSHALPIWVA